MTLGLRGKLFGTTLAVAIVVLAAGGVYLQRELRASLEGRIDAQLLHLARGGRVLIEREPSLDPAAIDPLATRLGGASDVRVTIIARDGEVIGDSMVEPARLPAIESHENRPEVIEALRDGEGRARRYSTTLQSDLHYVAVPFEAPSPGGVIRVARPLADVDIAVAKQRDLLLGVGLVALLAVVVLTALTSHWLSRTLRELVLSARAIAAGDAGLRVPVRSADELAGLAGSVNRIAEELGRSLSELAAERAQLSAVLDGMGEALIAVDGERRVTLVNSAAERLLGIEGGVGRSLVELVRAPALLDRMQQGGDGPVEIEQPCPGAAPRKLRARVSQQSGGGWVVVMEDVTELRRLETIRRDFVANVSHELRTPVSVIAANSETLQAGALDDRAHAPKLVEAIHRNAERLSTLVGDLLDLSRLEAGRRESELSSVRVAEVAAAAVDGLAGRAAERDIELRVNVDGDLEAAADPGALHQILQNLLDNAIKYTPTGSHVRVTGARREDRVRITVADDGPGIERRHRERVFERFYRVDPGRSREMGGTGLGLSIVKHLAEDMGGTVGVAANEPRGTRFWVELPVPTDRDHAV